MIIQRKDFIVEKTPWLADWVPHGRLLKTRIKPCVLASAPVDPNRILPPRGSSFSADLKTL